MKKVLFISLFFFTCHSAEWAQTDSTKNYISQLNAVNQQIRAKQDTIASKITAIKELAKKKTIYRTITIIQHDTAWRTDTCVTVYKPIDSATIAIMYKLPEIQKEIKVGKRFRIVILKRKKNEK